MRQIRSLQVLETVNLMAGGKVTFDFYWKIYSDREDFAQNKYVFVNAGKRVG